MTATFDPNIPADPNNTAAPCIEGNITSVMITEVPHIGTTNLVVDPGVPFSIDVNWSVFGNLVPVWLTALSVQSPNWVVTAYAEPEGPGNKVDLGTVNVPVSAQPLSLKMDYTGRITVPAGKLHEENPGDPRYSGVYKIIVTTFLDSTLGAPGYDMIGYAEGPIIKAENTV